MSLCRRWIAQVRVFVEYRTRCASGWRVRMLDGGGGGVEALVNGRRDRGMEGAVVGAGGVATLSGWWMSMGFGRQ